MNDQNLPVLQVPQREIPIPSSISPEAQAQLAAKGMSSPPWPDLNDIDGWRRTIALMDEVGATALSMLCHATGADVAEADADGARVYVITPRERALDGLVYIDIHGGSLVWGGGESCRAMGVISAGLTGATVWAVDYRLPPDHPYPAGLDDCVAAYRALLRSRPPEQIVIGGASAGGNLVAATILRARDEGLPLPAGAVLLTPEVDLTESGDTFNTLMGVDTALTSRLMPANLLYAAGQDLRHPYLSPIFADFSKGFSPTLLVSGTRDLFLSNTVRMHRALRKAGIEADLHVFEAATHVGFMFGPEADDRMHEIRTFLKRCLARG